MYNTKCSPCILLFQIMFCTLLFWMIFFGKVVSCLFRSFFLAKFAVNVASDSFLQIVARDHSLHIIMHYNILDCVIQNLQIVVPDMEFVQNFTPPDFEAKNFTSSKCVICNIFHSRLNSINALKISNLGMSLVMNLAN